MLENKINWVMAVWMPLLYSEATEHCWLAGVHINYSFKQLIAKQAIIDQDKMETFKSNFLL